MATPSKLSASKDPKMPSPPGYHLGRVLGQGGMGVVYLGKQLSLNRKVAIKVLHPQFTQMVHVKRLLREGRALATLRHNNILSVIDFVQDQGRIYLVMEYIQGVTLSKVIQKLKTAKRPTASLFKKCCKGGADWTYPENHYFDLVRKIFIDLAKGMQHAHEHKILHRDIKPSNIMITSSGKPFLLDFGLSTVANEVTLTSPQEILGTPLYMAPEQIEGAQLNPSTDIYSLGATLYQTLGLKTAHYATSQVALLHSVVNTDPKPISQINPHLPKAFEKIVNKAMARKPQQRYQSMNEMAADLESLQFSEGPQESNVVYEPKTQGFLPWFFLIAGVALMSWGFWWFLKQPIKAKKSSPADMVASEKPRVPLHKKATEEPLLKADDTQNAQTPTTITQPFTGKIDSISNLGLISVVHPEHGVQQIELAYLDFLGEDKEFFTEVLMQILKDESVLVNPIPELKKEDTEQTPAEIFIQGNILNTFLLSTGLAMLNKAVETIPPKYRAAEMQAQSQQRGYWNPDMKKLEHREKFLSMIKQRFAIGKR